MAWFCRIQAEGKQSHCWHCQSSRDSRPAATEISQREHININEESGCDKKNDVPEEVMLAKTNKQKCFSPKEVMEIFHSTESAKAEMLEANPNLVKSMILAKA